MTINFSVFQCLIKLHISQLKYIAHIFFLHRKLEKYTEKVEFSWYKKQIAKTFLYSKFQFLPFSESLMLGSIFFYTLSNICPTIKFLLQKHLWKTTFSEYLSLTRYMIKLHVLHMVISLILQLCNVSWIESLNMVLCTLSKNASLNWETRWMI